MDTLSVGAVRVDTVRVELITWLLTVRVEPIPVEKLRYSENIVDVFKVDTVSVEFTVWLLTVRVEPTPAK